MHLFPIVYLALANELWTGCMYCEQYVNLISIVYLALAKRIVKRVCVV